jgi:Tfp pilus assembly protein PilW
MRERTAPDTVAAESGFSLTELLVSMVMTVIVTGAIFALLTGGQNAFRREPEFTDRQQNIRVAMDMIMRDVAAAGAGMPTFVQTFRVGANADGISGTALNGAGPVGPTGVNADDLEMLTNPGGLDGEQACHVAGGATDIGIFRALRPSPAPPPVPVGQLFMIFLENGKWTMRQSTGSDDNGATSATCAAVGAQVLFVSAPNPSLNVGGACVAGAVGTAGGDPGCRVLRVGVGEIVGYRIRVTAGVPNLERRSSSSVTGSWGNAVGWQVVARSIENMQVQYERATAAGNPTLGWFDSPLVVRGDPSNADAQTCDPMCGTPLCTPSAGCSPPAANGWNTLVRQVRVTLTARSEAQRIQGMTTAPSGPARIRGDLTSTGAVRSALIALSREDIVASTRKWQ